MIYFTCEDAQINSKQNIRIVNREDPVAEYTTFIWVDIVLSFKDQLRRSQEGWYETKLLWKTNTNELPPNKAGSLGRLRVLLRNSKKNPLKFNQYNDII